MADETPEARLSREWADEHKVFQAIEADVAGTFPGLDEDAQWELSRRVWAWSKRGIDATADQREQWAGEIGS